MFISKKNFKYRNKKAWEIYRALQEAEKNIRLLEAIVEGYKRTLKGVEKEAEFYKNKYEMEVKKNEKLEDNNNFERGNYRRFRVLPPCIGQRLP